MWKIKYNVVLGKWLSIFVPLCRRLSLKSSKGQQPISKNCICRPVIMSLDCIQNSHRHLDKLTIKSGIETNQKIFWKGCMLMTFVSQIKLQLTNYFWQPMFFNKNFLNIFSSFSFSKICLYFTVVCLDTSVGLLCLLFQHFLYFECLLKMYSQLVSITVLDKPAVLSLPITLPVMFAELSG